ncbi:3-oxoacyl-[acyl-carrier-protein] reductase [Streptomyces scopuliridis]|uniref:3-oxoacyl-[acyl-carrier-protein] reductase n=2 Tax=Streptomyces scopuliridis TaxID=452529 RepID=A0A2T7TG76_9ACTN|nr:3-oxoacyl-[acyl-carrier-protein] reductase [Streptomyces scopuliridis]PVE14136.1 3-oxoacyl-ACP reductase [Streptomyces scopuliridis RB72]WSB31708.1 3-oxoacyl-[acyl-carrier-protein] reductase [Streptomyces scopuliridis]WSB95955.1 3-oxoacyl-[acyl-carrier-protein] reductase [Streptomyces scopuliridis]WSC10338.1 3-oxoacyl-[acyl-carrier-protein] reductase [Streptomyces scopuliridis]
MEQDRKPVALVSGGSRGIGRAVVKRLAADGHEVSFCYRSDDQAASSLEKELAELDVRVMARKVEVASPDSVREWVAETQETLGTVDVAVTAAGITRDNPLLMMTDEQWKDVLAVNLDGVYNVCRSVVFEMMKRRSGSLVLISSVAGVYGHATQSNYAATKAGIIGFGKSLAKEVGRYGIRSNVVAPGFIETDMTSVLNDKIRDQMLKSIALNRFGDAGEVADLVSFLASERAGYITGSVFQIDGGITI